MNWMNPQAWLIGLIAIAVVSGASALSGYRHGVSVTNMEWQSRWDKRDKADLSAALAQAKESRAKEQAHLQRQATIAAHYQEMLDHAQIANARDIADIRSRTLQLRQRFTCHEADRGLSQAASGAGGGDGATPRGLQPADAEFFVRFAQQCDAVAEQLSQAQAVIQSDRLDPAGEGSQP